MVDLDSLPKSSESLRMAPLKSLMPVVEVQLMGTAALDCPGVKENGISAGKFGARLTPPTPARTVPPTPPLGVVPVAVDEYMDQTDLAILRVVTLGIRSHLSLLIRLT